MQSIEVIDLWLRNKVEVVVDLKRLSPHSTGELCAVKVARIVRRGLCLREGTRLPYYNDNLIFERSIPMAKRRKFTAKFKAEVVLEALSSEISQAELWGPSVITSAKTTLNLETETVS